MEGVDNERLRIQLGSAQVTHGSKVLTYSPASTSAGRHTATCGHNLVRSQPAPLSVVPTFISGQIRAGQTDRTGGSAFN